MPETTTTTTDLVARLAAAMGLDPGEVQHEERDGIVLHLPPHVKLDEGGDLPESVHFGLDAALASIEVSAEGRVSVVLAAPRRLFELAEAAKGIGEFAVANAAFARLYALQATFPEVGFAWEQDTGGDPYYDLAVLTYPDAPSVCVPAPLLNTLTALHMYQSALDAGTVRARREHDRATRPPSDEARTGLRRQLKRAGPHKVRVAVEECFIDPDAVLDALSDAYA